MRFFYVGQLAFDPVPCPVEGLVQMSTPLFQWRSDVARNRVLMTHCWNATTSPPALQNESNTHMGHVNVATDLKEITGAFASTP